MVLTNLGRRSSLKLAANFLFAAIQLSGNSGKLGCCASRHGNAFGVFLFLPKSQGTRGNDIEEVLAAYEGAAGCDVGLNSASLPSMLSFIHFASHHSIG